MGELLISACVFLATHMLPALAPVRRRLVARLGTRLYLILYSGFSLAAIVWLAVAYARAPYVEVWPPAPWTRWVPLLVMPVASILFIAALTSANPLSVAPGRLAFDPARPGIVSVTRHPLMWAFALWAGAHCVANGDVAALVLFGLFLFVGLLGPPSLDAKRRTALGRATWTRLAGPTSNVPFAAVIAGRARLDWRGIGLRRLLGGLMLYALLIAAHPWIIGVSPWPG